ncbi:condensin subunit Smc [Candidatus Kryptonium thompsonii]|uniref:Chromosome partition protein Smc n=1 Tax=Candidatus Kryptonium thompsonii TaxID=1633631 RepID=A0A0P1M047_9BACT|nr:chromosome segregation protein SMC [Candidatus Kryptonium thompsoni]CUS77047.1 condensin subunit Smc [Candidatus Kryptonium thompsoni]CUS77504.1 condensin subunit Smc [Candidatus Kryptonium thompsoni]CUS80694.1 condensin subunit Smc [Candidatus Kryptonium thompsoni]CUS81724.1 condensin subunit Smc [Candidatus Kryptonium thompsoni]CUS87975.1 condensin subunit Smc [Candidatus Kryptonium thompsoni]
MYLSRLEIFGFKSFAHKVELKFNGGITVIVGPNGCGKTNIVDAIRWVLGEQRASILRSDKMEDVIFNGTRNRKPLGMAEVSITIENTKGILPMEYAEVTITRRIFRSGESEYFLNKVPCRLKDIIDLFADTGMGANAYSVIELKMIESLLSEKAEERRKLFEEAAGITKYKQRKKVTLRKIEDVKGDLSRINDIIREVQKNVASLERQAKKAEKYNQIFEELKSKEIELLEKEFSEFHRTLIYLEETLNRERSKKISVGDELSKGEQILEVLKNELKTIEEQVEEIHLKIETSNRELSLTEQEIVLLKERKKMLMERIEKMSQDKVNSQHLLYELNQKVNEKRLLYDANLIEKEKVGSEFSEKKKELDGISKNLDEKRIFVKNLNEALINKMNEISRKRSEIEKIKARAENLRGKVDLLNDERMAYEKEISEAEIELNTCFEKRATLLNELANAERIFNEMEILRKSLETEIEELQRKSFEIQNEYEKKISKIDFLRELVEKHVDLPEGAQFLVQNYNSNFKSVSDVIEVEPEFSLAIESALGESAGYLIVDTVEEAEKAIDVLKSQNKSKVTFICLDKIRENYASNLPVRGDGIIGWANEIVSCERKFKKVIDLLLDEFIVVKDRSSAFEALKNYGSVKCVTLEGEIFTDEGLIKGGSTNGSSQSIIGKRKQIETLEREAERLKNELNRIQNEVDKKIREIDAINLKELSDVVKNIQVSVTEVEKIINQLEYRKTKALESIANIDREKIEIEKEMSTLSEVLTSLEGEVVLLEKEKEKIEYDLSIATSEFEALEREWSLKAKYLTELNINLVSIENEEKNLESEIKRLEDEIARVSSKISEYDIEIEEVKLQIENIESNLVELNDKHKMLEEEISMLRERLKEVQSQHSEKVAEIQSLERKIREERAKYEEYISATHDIEMKINEIKLRMQNLKERAREEYQIELEYKEFENYNIAVLKEEVENLKAKLKLLGPVNLLAFNDYQEEKKRLEFLLSQREDLLESEKTLKETIEEINTTAERKFLETFEKIRENFKKTFETLFGPESEADLRLLPDEDGRIDPLESKIEIMAKPKGKRLQSIDLLSAGEKTLTAIALLFAIYLVKPSPFCVLDEVDAPLDDANIDRFINLLKVFSKDTQFIIVTHNKKTMEAADTYYGVTMEEEGVSKIVSVRFKQGVEQG